MPQSASACAQVHEMEIDYLESPRSGRRAKKQQIEDLHGEIAEIRDRHEIDMRCSPRSSPQLAPRRSGSASIQEVHNLSCRKLTVHRFQCQRCQSTDCSRNALPVKRFQVSV